MGTWGGRTAFLAALSCVFVACGDNEISVERPGSGTPSPTPAATSTQARTATPAVTQGGQTPTQAPAPTVTPTPERLCGNGVVDDIDEECDGSDLDDWTCEGLCDQDDEGGTLRCNPDCTFDFSGCPPPRDCGA